MAQIGGRNVGNNDIGVMAGGLVVLVFSFVGWFGKGSYSQSGWNSGFLAWLGILLAIAAAVLVALRVFANVSMPRLQVGWSLIALALAGLATLLILLKLIVGYKYSIAGLVSVKLDRKVGLFLSLIGAAVETAFAYLTFKASGEALPNLGKGGRSGTR